MNVRWMVILWDGKREHAAVAANSSLAMLSMAVVVMLFAVAVT